MGIMGAGLGSSSIFGKSNPSPSPNKGTNFFSVRSSSSSKKPFATVTAGLPSLMLIFWRDEAAILNFRGAPLVELESSCPLRAILMFWLVEGADVGTDVGNKDAGNNGTGCGGTDAGTTVILCGISTGLSSEVGSFDS